MHLLFRKANKYTFKHNVSSISEWIMMINKKLRVKNLGMDFSGKPLPQAKNRFLMMGAVALLGGTIATAMSACDNYGSPGLPINSGGNAGSGAVAGSGGKGGVGAQGGVGGNQTGGTGGDGGIQVGGNGGFGGEGAHAGEGGVGGSGGTTTGGSGGVGGQGGAGGQAGSAGSGGAGGQINCPTAFNDAIVSQDINLNATMPVGGYDFTYLGEGTLGAIMDIECGSNNVAVATQDCAIYTITTIAAPDKQIDIEVHSVSASKTRVSITVY
jgi:hypothetical protein